MFKNYLKVTLRNITKQKAYTFINITGLAVGLAACILIFMYVIHELSYDKFHANADRIYRIGIQGNLGGDDVKYPLSNLGTGPAMMNDYPEVQSYTRLQSVPKWPLKYKEKTFFEENMVFADPGFFDVFSFPLIQGDPEKALEAPYSMVMTRDMADKYFSGEDPLGKELRLNNSHHYRVTGVIENFPENSHLRVDALCSIESFYVMNNRKLEEWNNFNGYTYILLRENVDPVVFSNKLPGFVDKYLAEMKKMLGESLNFFIQPITDIHLRSKLGYEMPGNSDIAYVYVFSAIAFFILLIACINFMNLATARSAGRAKEVGLRKVMGAEKHMLIKQFLFESMFFCFLSLILAVALVRLALPLFRSTLGIKLIFPLADMPWLIAAFIGFTLLTSLLAGSYPAFFLSAFQPANIMRGPLKSGASSSRFRSVLVVTQFIISIALVAGTGIMLGQLNFIKDKDLGFDKENVIVIPIMDRKLRERLPEIKSEIASHSDVLAVCAASDLPGGNPDYSAFVPEGYTKEETQLMHRINADAEMIPAMEMEIITGRNFSNEFSTDPQGAVIINETAARTYGWEDPVGKKIGFYTDNEMHEVIDRTVVGVVRDFHVRSLHDKILPLVLSNQNDYFDDIGVRIKAGALSGTLDFLKEKWMTIDPNRPFNYYMLDSKFSQLYQKDARLSTIIGYFTLFAIFVACLGLYGMASFMAEKRSKEIGIRKTLGASVPNIIVLISKDVVKLILIAALIAFPIAYYTLNRWLAGFAYRTDINPLSFLYSAAIVFVIGYATIAFQSVKAALSNPVDAIRTE